MNSLFTKIVYICFFSWFCLIGPVRPIANYDMFPYVGAVLSYSDHGSSLREDSLGDVRKYVSEVQYKAFVNGTLYVETVAKDDNAFLEQLPGYRVKPLYVLLTGFLSIATGNISFASVVVSSIGFFLMATALYLLRPKGFLEPFYLITVMLFVYLGTPTFTIFSSVSSPDSLAIGLTLLGFWALLRYPHSYQSMILLSLAILARPDTIVTLACLTPFIIKMSLDQRAKNENYRFLVMTIVLPFFIYLGSTLIFPSFNLKQLIVFAFEGPFPHLSSIDTSHFWKIYIPALYGDVVALLSLPRFVILLVTNIGLLIFLSSKKINTIKNTSYVLFAALGNIFLKIILFPNFDGGFGERFFCTSYFLIIYSLFAIIEDHLHVIALGRQKLSLNQ